MAFGAGHGGAQGGSLDITQPTWMTIMQRRLLPTRRDRRHGHALLSAAPGAAGVVPESAREGRRRTSDPELLQVGIVGAAPGWGQDETVYAIDDDNETGDVVADVGST